MAVPEINFRSLRVDDLEVLVGWFAEPDVARWWDQPATLDAVSEKYLPRIEGREPTRMWIVEIDAVRASWRALERAGFVRRWECDPPDEPPAYVYSVARGG